ncbi:MAG: glycosyltransferase [Flavobacteriales bacterium]|nr:glycosyltransferase [Flavobacteriales bacterium]
MFKPTILFTSSWYPSRVHDTLGNFVSRHAEAVAIQTRVVALYVTSDPDLKEDIDIEFTEKNNVETIIVYYKKVNSSFPILSQFQKYKRNINAFEIGLLWIKDNLNIESFDLVHHNITYPTGIFPMRLKEHKDTPYIISENFTGFLPAGRHKYKGLLMKYLCKKITRNATIICPVSLDLEKSMKQLGFDSEYVIVPNVVDTITFHTKEDEPSQLGEKIKFIHVSTLDEKHKNVKGILRVIQKLSNAFDVELNIIHDEDSSLLKTYCEDLKIAGRVNFLGQKDAKGVSEELRNNDIFILFSNYENLPCVVLESIACGVPVISSDVGGTREHLSSEFGELVSPLDEEALLNKIKFMIENYSKYDPKALHHYAQLHFSKENVGKQFMRVYEEVLLK